MDASTGTSGGGGGTGGARRRLALLLGGAFVATVLVVMVANAESMIADFAAAGVDETAAHVWLWEASSIVGWLTAAVGIWWLVGRCRRWLGCGAGRWPVLQVAGALAAGSVAASAWHIGVMVAIRVVAYRLEGSRYDFFHGIADPFVYEYRKDLATFCQFVGYAWLSQYLLSRVDAEAVVSPPAAVPVLAVADGAVTHRVPADEIDWVAAAGNYVELGWRERPLLHRATLASVEAELGAAFVRIGRGRLVRRAAIRRIETDRSGDFTVTLVSGEAIRGSRRYRAGMEAPDRV